MNFEIPSAQKAPKQESENEKVPEPYIPDFFEGVEVEFPTEADAQKWEAKFKELSRKDAKDKGYRAYPEAYNVNREGNSLKLIWLDETDDLSSHYNLRNGIDELKEAFKGKIADHPTDENTVFIGFSEERNLTKRNNTYSKQEEK